MSPMVSEQYEFVIGVDTHAASHTFAVIAAATGAVLGHAVFPTSAAGLSRAPALSGPLDARVSNLIVAETQGNPLALPRG